MDAIFVCIQFFFFFLEQYRYLYVGLLVDLTVASFVTCINGRYIIVGL